MLELGPRNIRVVGVVPGLTSTEGTAIITAGKAAIDFILSRTPFGRLGTPADIAAAVAFVVSDDGRWITGDTLQVGGGLTLSRCDERPSRSLEKRHKVSVLIRQMPCGALDMTRLIPALAALAAVFLYLMPAPALAESIPGSHPHRGGGKRHGAATAPISATTPDLKGTSREEADREYREKYGF